MFRATFGHAAIRQDASLDGHGDELGASRGDAPVTKNPSSHAAAALVVTPFRSSQACREVFHSSHPRLSSFLFGRAIVPHRMRDAYSTDVGAANPLIPRRAVDVSRQSLRGESRQRERFEAIASPVRRSHSARASMGQAKPLRVRKDPLEVELALAGSEPRQVELFLAEHGSHAFSRQRVLDLLEQGDGFLPACDVETGQWESFNARAVVWIGLARPSVDAESSADELFEHRRRVRVSLKGGGSLEGEVLYSAPDGGTRLVDYLNRRERFLRLWDGDRIFLVNKESVLRVVEERSGD
jgi:hypothetical protein